MIVIDQITTSLTASRSHTVSSQDAVLVVLTFSTGGAGTSTVFFNGNSLTNLTEITGEVGIFYMVNPPVGTYTLTQVNAGTTKAFTALTLLGVDKKDPIPIGVAAASGTINITPSKPGSLILNINDTSPSNLATDGLTILSRISTLATVVAKFNAVSSNFKIVWNSFSIGGVAIALSPASSPSIWTPSINFRNIDDTSNVNSLHLAASVSGSFGNYPSIFYQNSFLHTVGRLTAAPDVNAGTQIRKLETLRDDFNSSFDTNTWNPNGSSNIRVDNNQLKIDIDTSGTNYFTAQSVQSYDMTSSFVFVQVPSIGNQQANWEGVFLVQNKGDSNNKYYFDILNGILTAYEIANGVKTQVAANVPYNATIHQWWRIRESGGTMFFETSIDSIYWSTFITRAISSFFTPQNVEVALQAGSFGVSTVTTMVFDNLNTPKYRTLFTQLSNPSNDDFVRTQVWDQSFLHTVGRIIKPQPTLATLAAETEQETSQIIIDKIFQGELAAQALSIVTLNMQISIPSPDAVLVVTGGSVITTGAAWTSVQYNGNSLIKLVQAAVAGADAEIWYLPYPSVGTGTLSISSGTGGEIYANAMVILGIDKRSTNIMTASTTDAASTSTIGAQITPDAPNSLVIDALSTLNATTFPVQDSSQTQVFNASALVGNEYVLSTYKIATGQQNMNYNLSVTVNASLVVASFRPAQAPSMWFPNIDSRELDDVVTVSDLDAGTNPAFGNYGYKGSQFYLNSFLHTVGRMPKPSGTAFTPSTLLMMGIG